MKTGWWFIRGMLCAWQPRLRISVEWPVLAAAILVLWMVGSAQAQTSNNIALALVWSSAEVRGSSVAWGDVDGDGDLDLAVSDDRQPTRLYRNDGGMLTSGAVWFSSESGLTLSVAWGDVDGDGDLDLAVGNNGQPNRLYRNDGGVLTTSAVWSSHEVDATYSVAWGDVDGDGDLDLAVGNDGQPNRLYGNDSGVLTTNAVWSSSETDATFSVAWGDMDGDGDLDLAVGNGGVLYREPSAQPNRLYRNDGGVLTTSAVWSSSEADVTFSVAWGDVDGDGDLDLAVGNYGYNRLYRNDGGVLSASAAWSSREVNKTGGVAWGDVDGDGDLDLGVGNVIAPISLYRNDGGVLTTSTVWSSREVNSTWSVAWGDVEGDGDLDLAGGNLGPIRLYRNDGGVLATNTMWSSGEADATYSVAWGDVDGDGDLDLAVGNNGQPIRLYRNDGGVLTTSAVWWSVEADDTTSVAWGDVDGDGDLDLAVGNGGNVLGNYGQSNRLYRNDGGVLTASPVWSSLEADITWSIAWGDVDGDGDLDLAVGNYYQPNRLYRNDGGVLTASAVWSSREADATFSVAWGDVDGDGDLDLAVGNYNGQPSRLYRNDGGVLTASAVWSSREADYTQSVAWGDVDGDGDLDLAVGNNGQPNHLYRNDGGVLTTSAVWASVEADTNHSVAWGDVDGDGDLDLATSSYFDPNRLYRNDSGVLSASAAWSSVGGGGSVAWGDVDGDGDLDLAGGNWNGSNRLYRNERNMLAFHGSAPTTDLKLPGSLGQANLYASATIWSSPDLPVRYHLFQAQSNRAQRVLGYYSLDGGDHWRPASPTSDTVTTNLASAPYPTINITNTHVYTWDVAASGVMGQSDNVVFRLVVVPDLTPSRNAIPGPFIHGSYAATTFPFRLRGTQVQVLQPEHQPASGTLVYRLLNGQTSNAQPYTDRMGLPYHTDTQGYLQGRGELRNDDRLAALWPVSAANLITFTHNVTVYHTNAKPTVETLDMQPVHPPGVQLLTVSADNKLLLFNLDVALEWDARKDSQFMEQLKFNLRRTSELLFDWTNGQAALGQVRIFHDAKRNTAVVGFHPWDDSHIRIYATNRMRPSATVGGIISPTLNNTETIVLDGKPKTLSYGAGQVHIGAVWNRYGGTSGTLGEDWPRALAHELGHYLFFLEDDYLGVNDQGVLVTIPAEGPSASSCPSVMNDPYREALSEFHPQSDWASSGCAKTLAQQSTGRSDWETITKFYPLIAPTESFSAQNQGPSTLPLAITQLQVISSTATAQTVDVPIFYLTNSAGGTYLPSSNAQAYLFQGDWLTELGQPILDQVQAWGARPGDRLCLYEVAAGYLGCEPIRAQDDQVTMKNVGLWQPAIVVTAATSRTIALSVTVALGDKKLSARLYSEDAPAPGCILLQAVGPGQYTGTFPALSVPALSGRIHLWVQPGADAACNEPQGEAVLETVTGYAIGGNPIHRQAQRDLTRGAGVHRRARRAPVVSADGQVIVFGEALDANEDQAWFFTLQATSSIAGLPLGRTLVGQAYRLTASPNAPPLTDTSISFSYLADQVPVGEESFLHLYFWVEKSTHWQPLETFVDTEYQVASAKTQGPGLYALMSSLEIPLTGPGWNLFAYTVQYTQTVPQALASLTNHYTVIWGYDSNAPDDPWHAYSPKVAGTIFAPLVNDLTHLEYGHGYWIQMLDDATLYLPSTPAAIAANSDQAGQPPTTYYGSVLAQADFVPTAGMSVTAWVNGYMCGQSETRNIEGQIVYAVQVAADDGGTYARCGAVGRPVTFKVNDVPMATIARWDNTDVWQAPLVRHFDNHLFLPSIFSSTHGKPASATTPTVSQSDQRVFLAAVDK